jgi:hypothetical protein
LFLVSKAKQSRLTRLRGFVVGKRDFAIFYAS